MIPLYINTQTNNSITYWVMQIIVTMIIFFIVRAVFKKITELKEELLMSNIINASRNKISFQEHYQNHEYYLLPNETIEEFNKRNLNGIYDKRIQEEVNMVYNNSLKVFKNKSIKQIEKLISKHYSINQK